MLLKLKKIRQDKHGTIKITLTLMIHDHIMLYGFKVSWKYFKYSNGLECSVNPMVYSFHLCLKRRALKIKREAIEFIATIPMIEAES
jgi:hypothetical protein